MSTDQIGLFMVLAGVFVFFAWGRWRYDIVAFAALMVCVLIGIVPSDTAFTGFSHPAVITVAAVLIVSKGLANSGAIDRVAHIVVPPLKNLAAQIGVMSGFAAVLSAVMNNVAALALLMPASIESAKRAGRSPALLLMPLSFGSILGGLITLIGTPPNIVIGNYRSDVLGAPFSMFDFAPVGLAVAAVGIAYLALAGWRLLPKERQAKSAPEELFDIDAYMAEVRVPAGSSAAGKSLVQLEKVAESCDLSIAGIVRNHKPMLRVPRSTEILANDILLLETGPKELDTFVHKLGLETIGSADKDKGLFASDDVVLAEAVISADSRLIGRESGELRLRSRYGLNLLGVSRQGQAIRKRLHKLVFRSGDVLLLQGDADGIADTMARLRILPLAERGFLMGKRNQAWIAASLLAGAVALAGLGVVGLTVALALAALGMVLFSVVPLRDLYDAIDWPVIVLVAAMIPIGGALETTGATALITESILRLSGSHSPAFILMLLFIATMTLSDLMNNVATAVMMAPIGTGLAQALGANPDSFLMAVAVGSSCAFLTPIGHKNNALVMGPGGYHFGDYWRVGLPLELLIIAVAMPMILWVWPL
ncbi:SLC13 family permease [Kordiimonas marina]|uniref:SLC13 family permease n=1 Tax=Kordiimonas marina TaxID=2872312 RepID=UPI001FF1F96F|nr:SLC13 family permease [Kordiimonas marina]MCJ9429650.1 SLC13 family permease [Kordiimonas marina]